MGNDRGLKDGSIKDNTGIDLCIETYAKANIDIIK